MFDRGDSIRSLFCDDHDKTSTLILASLHQATTALNFVSPISGLSKAAPAQDPWFAGRPAQHACAQPKREPT